ncbi:MAG: M14 family zinc carboxypeptidase [bacterium]
MKKIILLLLVPLLNCYAQVNLTNKFFTPLELAKYRILTSHEDIVGFLDAASSLCNKIKLEFIGSSSEGRMIPAVKISTGEFGRDENKIKVFFFAQQHGDEPSGKEGTLMLIRDITEGKLDYLFEKIDLIIVPQMNPDGAERNKRRNGMGLDLNRNHLILTAPETQALHKLFNQYLPEATLDVHEYSPYSNDWIEYGALKNFDEQFGAVSNPNVSIEIKNYTRNQLFPFVEKYIMEKGFSFQEYIVEGPPDKGRMRHSTFDINDGRQSFGSLNTFSMILEGKNGRDSIDNIRRRAEGQYTAMKGILEFIFNHKVEIKKFVADGRRQLINSIPGEKVAIQMEHMSEGTTTNIRLLSLYSNADTIVTVENYTPVVKPLLEVEKPVGYLIPKADANLTGWAERQNLQIKDYTPAEKFKIIQYFITTIDSIDFEGDMTINPSVELKEVTDEINPFDFYFIPMNQLHNNFIVQALEPQSEIGLATYKDFEYLVRKNKSYPILKVIE